MEQEENNVLNNKQREAVQHPGGPLLIAAGAGSGKTKTLTSRLIHLINSGVRPDQVVAITFTNKAAEEMRSRVANSKWPIANGQWPMANSDEDRTKNYMPLAISHKLFIGTFHSLGVRILKAEAGYFGRTAGFAIFAEDDSLSLIKKICKEMNLDKEQYSPLMFQTVIGKVKNELMDEPSGKIHALVFNKYEELLRDCNAFDFDDLIQKVVLVLQNEPDVLRKYQDRWQHILVDEFQDVNTSQYEMVRLLAQEHQNLSVVGDDFQAIYKFRGADYRNFLNFEKDWPNAKIVLLEENYRSTGNIIQAANAVIKNNKLQKPKTLWTQKEAGDLVRVVVSGDENEEAEWVVKKIIASTNPTKFNFVGSSNEVELRRIAVLYRTNAQSRAIEQNLIAAGIPYKIFGGIRFYDRKEIKDIIAALRLANNPLDTVSAERLLKSIPKAMARQIIADMPRLGRELNILELINYFLNTTDYFEYLEKHQKNAEERIENVKELILFAGQFIGQKVTVAQPVSSNGFVNRPTTKTLNDTLHANPNENKQHLQAFLEQVSLASSADIGRSNVKGQMPARRSSASAGGSNVVNLMTIHLAKGLEFKTVFVIGCNEGTLPHHRSYDEHDGIEEERRLMYVAMTRAKKNLFLSFYNIASRFLYEIPPQLTDFVKNDFSSSSSLSLRGAQRRSNPNNYNRVDYGQNTAGRSNLHHKDREGFGQSDDEEDWIEYS